MVESLGTEKYLTRSYAIDGDPSKGVISLHLAYYTGMMPFECAPGLTCRSAGTCVRGYCPEP